MSIEEPQILNLSAELSEAEFTEVISISIICRLCTNQSDKLIGIYSEDGISNDLSGKMNLYLPIKVSETDNLPLQCCWQCASTVLAWHDLVVTSVEADRRFRSYQKQLVEIKYEGSDSLLPNNAEEHLHCDKKQCNESLRQYIDNEDSKNASLDLSIKTTTEKQKECFYVKENTTKSKCSIPENVIEDLTVSTGFSDGEDISLPPHDNGLPNVDLKYNENTKRYANFDAKTCNICESKFTSEIILKKHLNAIHNVKLSKIRRKKCDITAPFTCFTCKKNYTRKHDLEKHVKSKHPLEDMPRRKLKNTEHLNKFKIKSSEGETLYQCDVCTRTFKKSYSLTRHRTIHSNYKPHCCHFCGKGFRLTSSLIRHINEYHENKRKFKCKVCDKVFKNKFTRDEHLNIHSNVRPYVCDMCGKSFRQSASLYVHKKFHWNNFPFACKVCNKSFRTRQNFHQHSLIHTGYKPYICQQCGVSFKSKQDLNRHSKCHVTVCCDKCGATFGQMRYMKLHSCQQSRDCLSQKKTGEHFVGGKKEETETKGVIIKNEVS